VKARQVEMRRVTSSGDPKRFNQARRPKYLFSGLTKCAECVGGYVMYWRDRLPEREVESYEDTAALGDQFSQLRTQHVKAKLARR
jgi:hypothetical protein